MLENPAVEPEGSAHTALVSFSDPPLEAPCGPDLAESRANSRTLVLAAHRAEENRSED